MALTLMWAAICSCASVVPRVPGDELSKTETPEFTGSIVVVATLAESGSPAQWANVILLGTRRSEFSDSVGRARFDKLTPGVARFKVQAIGRMPLLDSVLVRAGATDTLRCEVSAETVEPLILWGPASRDTGRGP